MMLKKFMPENMLGPFCQSGQFRVAGINGKVEAEPQRRVQEVLQEDLCKSKSCIAMMLQTDHETCSAAVTS